MPPDDPKEKDKDGLKLGENKEFQDLTKMVKGLGALVQAGQKAQAKMQENFTALMAKLDETAPTKEKTNDDPNPDAINELDNAGLVKVILTEVGKVMDEKVKTISDSLGETRTELQTSELKKEFTRLSGEHKDFKEWGNEMSALAQKHPTLGLEDLYHKARRENNTKAAELDLKYEKETKGKDRDGTPRKFMGMFPTSGIDDDGDEKKLTAKEAEDKAWNETIEQFPALALSGDE